MSGLLTLEIKEVEKMLSSKNIFTNKELCRIEDLLSWQEGIIISLEEELNNLRSNYFDVINRY